MNQNRQYQQDLEAQASLRVLRKGIEQDLMMSSCFASDKPLSKSETKHQARLEKLLEDGYQEEIAQWHRESKLRGEAERRALERGLLAGDKTE